MTPPFNLPLGCTLDDIEGEDTQESERLYQIELEIADRDNDFEKGRE